MGDSSDTSVLTRPLGGRLRLPRLSGKASAAALVACFAVTAVLIPMTLHLAQWVEAEIVLGVWWLVWMVLLARLLYTGQRVSDDYQLREPRRWLPASWSEPSKSPPSQDPNRSWWDGFFWGSVVWDGEAIVFVVGIFVAGVLLFGVAWLVIEVAFPAIAFLAYLLVRGMLACVVNDRHHCRGRLLKSSAWAARSGRPGTRPR